MPDLADGQSVEWHVRGDSGQTEVRRDEPHANRWLDLKLWLQSLLVSEGDL